METSIFFEKIDTEKLGFAQNKEKIRLGDYITHLEPDEMEEKLRYADIALIGVNEDRPSTLNHGCSMAPDEIRKYFYSLYPVHKKLNIVDLGNIRQGEKISDTYFALKSVVVELLKADVVPVVLGGSKDLTYPIYLAFESVGRVINLVSIDPRIDNRISEAEEGDEQSYLSKIIMRKPNFLFNFTNIGYQSYFVDQDDVKLLNNLFFDTCRLGEIRSDLTEAEPMIRNADLLTFDISAVRQSDAPANVKASPNGFYGEEACQLMRYTGLAERLSCIGFFEMNPLYDRHGQTAQLIAQMIWYFLEGYSMRKNDYPAEGASSFVKYIVTMPGHENDLVFFKSKVSDRWWMQLPVSKDKETSLSRHVMAPCSYKDYLQAGKYEIPDRWWKTYQKLM
ncbi:MAG: formimidoylglutamase [Bacteroidales bacterium]|nr:formimidoylglutamase [Bacteroidales bacterium]